MVEDIKIDVLHYSSKPDGEVEEDVTTSKHLRARAYRDGYNQDVNVAYFHPDNMAEYERGMRDRVADERLMEEYDEM